MTELGSGNAKTMAALAIEDPAARCVASSGDAGIESGLLAFSLGTTCGPEDTTPGRAGPRALHEPANFGIFAVHS